MCGCSGVTDQSLVVMDRWKQLLRLHVSRVWPALHQGAPLFFVVKDTQPVTLSAIQELLVVSPTAYPGLSVDLSLDIDAFVCLSGLQVRQEDSFSEWLPETSGLVQRVIHFQAVLLLRREEGRDGHKVAFVKTVGHLDIYIGLKGRKGREGVKTLKIQILQEPYQHWSALELVVDIVSVFVSKTSQLGRNDGSSKPSLPFIATTQNREGLD